MADRKMYPFIRPLTRKWTKSLLGVFFRAGLRTGPEKTSKSRGGDCVGSGGLRRLANITLLLRHLEELGTVGASSLCSSTGI